MFASEPGAASPEAGVDFVENQQRAMLVTNAAKQGKKLGRWNIDPATALNRFNQYGSNRLVPEDFLNFGFGFVQLSRRVGEGNKVAEFAELWTKRATKMAAKSGVERAVAEPMISALERDDCRAFRWRGSLF
jgi:hypothetical protein